MIFWSWIGVVAAQQAELPEPDSVSRTLQQMNADIVRYREKQRQDSLARIQLLTEIETLRESEERVKSEFLNRLEALETQDSTHTAQQQHLVQTAREKSRGYPVAPDEDTLFFIYAKLGPVSALERATSVSQKIEKLIEDDRFFADSLRVTDLEATADVLYGQLILTSVTDWDALWLDADSKDSLAVKYRNIISAYVLEKRESGSLLYMARQAGLAVLIVTIAFLVIFLLNKGILKGQIWVVRRKSHFFKGIKIGNYEILPPSRQLELFRRAINVLKWVIFLLILYISLPVLFSIFPVTKDWAEVLLGWILNPARQILISFWHYLPNLFTIAVTVIAIHYVIRLVKFVAGEIQDEKLTIAGFHPDWAMPTFNIVKVLLYAFMFIVIFPYLPGSESEVFRGVSVFLGILFSLGSSSAIANAVAGLVITYMRPFKVGDRVKIGDVTGLVVEKTLLVTRIRTTKNEDITVPNSSILNGYTVNFSSSSKAEGLILHTGVTIGYDVPWRKVHALLIDAAMRTDGLDTNKEPFVLQTSLDDFYVSYQLNAYTEFPERMPRIYSDLHATIQDLFNQAGVEIMSPHYRAERDGSEITIPKTDA